MDLQTETTYLNVRMNFEYFTRTIHVTLLSKSDQVQNLIQYIYLP